MLPYRAQRVTEWFDGYENDVNHMLWPSQSADLNLNVTFWSDESDSHFPPPTSKHHARKLFMDESAVVVRDM